MTLREVFDELAGGGETDPAGALADRGYEELPDPLLSEAIVSFADTAPVEVAEHLAPFVMVHSAVPVDRAGEVPATDGLALLATAPEPIVADEEAAQLPEPQATGDLSYEGDFDFGQGDFADVELATAEPAPAAEPVDPVDPVEAYDIEEFEPAGDSWLAPAEPLDAHPEPEPEDEG